ncbi:MAG: xanthine dehydrogenase family protein subunit M [Firmicutes bacterium]|nr:xanthine dehydrogenase family protein subunit M [Bacillota bacterium]
MKSAPFEYLVPASLAEALETLAGHQDETKVLAGGQSLVPLLKLRLARPRYLLDINRVPELSYLELKDGRLHLGALTRHSALGREPSARGSCPLLAEAAARIGHTAIRNRGTVGGSLCHADPAAELPAAMIALGAELKIDGPGGTRLVPAAGFFQGFMTVDLQPDEILAGLSVPVAGPGTGWSYLEVSRRHGDFAIAGVAVWLSLDDKGLFRQVGIALAGVDDRPWKARACEDFLVGKEAKEEVIAAAREQLAGFDPTGDIHASREYRELMAGELFVQALRQAVERAANNL